MNRQTIAAIATPPGEGGIAIIRISGPKALDIANTVCSKNVHKLPTHTAHYDQILDGTQVIDHALIIPMRSPRSYTGEDTVEIQCHGGRMAQKVLEVILAAGAKPAGPGEFTYRAFLNGKLDLSQAEAVQTLIGAQNDLALQASKNQLDGALSKKIQAFQKRLADTAAILEAWVDFPEEGLEFASTQEVIQTLTSISQDMAKLQSTFHDGQKIQHGFTCCLIGAPNVGKSSLMNLLLGKARAIVTDKAGTTRDVIEDQLMLGHLHLRLLDTAGIRTTDEIIEQEGVRRTHETLQDCDLILLVLDISRPLNHDETQLIEKLSPQKTIVIWNKTDLSPTLTKLSFPHQVQMSAKEQTGLDDLKHAIEKAIWSKGLPDKSEVMLTQKRHHTALTDAINTLQQLIDGLNTGISCEFLASDMRAVLLNLSQICGTDVTEDVLDAIFANFCVGK